MHGTAPDPDSDEEFDRPVLKLSHPRVRFVEEDIFRLRFAPDCMTHACRCVDEGAKVRLDACCQHGADVDLWERDAILAKVTEIAAVLDPAFRDPARWFDDREPETDPDFPSGTCVRTATADPENESSGCVFLNHDARGCALHRAALAGNFAPESIKPAVCRLYPLSYGDGLLGLSDDFDRYSCANEVGGPTVYRLMRPLVLEMFGEGAVRLLDGAERKILGLRLPLVAHP